MKLTRFCNVNFYTCNIYYVIYLNNLITFKEYNLYYCFYTISICYDLGKK